MSTIDPMIECLPCGDWGDEAVSVSAALGYLHVAIVADGPTVAVAVCPDRDRVQSLIAALVAARDRAWPEPDGGGL